MAESRRLERLCPVGRAFSKHDGLPTAHALRGLDQRKQGEDQYQSNDRDKLDRRVQLSTLLSRLVAVSMPKY